MNSGVPRNTLAGLEGRVAVGTELEAAGFEATGLEAPGLGAAGLEAAGLEAAGLATTALAGAADGADAEGEVADPPHAATTRLSNALSAMVRWGMEPPDGPAEGTCDERQALARRNSTRPSPSRRRTSARSSAS